MNNRYIFRPNGNRSVDIVVHDPDFPERSQIVGNVKFFDTERRDDFLSAVRKRRISVTTPSGVDPTRG